MALTDQTYFEKRLIAISNLNRPETLADLNNYIELHEPDYRNMVLGYELNKEFEEGLEPEFPDQVWLDLRDGAEFTDCNGKLNKWTGFNNTIKESPIAYYTYFYLVREGNIILSGTGTISTKDENAERITPLVKLTDAWNYMVKYNRLLVQFIEANISDYPNYNPSDKLIKTENYFGI